MLHVSTDEAFLTLWSLFLSKHPTWLAAENPVEKQKQAGLRCPDDPDDIADGIFLLL